MPRSEAIFCILLVSFACLFIGWISPPFIAWVAVLSAIQHLIQSHFIPPGLNPVLFWAVGYLLTAKRGTASINGPLFFIYYIAKNIISCASSERLFLSSGSSGILLDKP